MRAEDIRGVLMALGARPPAHQSRRGYVVAHCPMAPYKHAGGVDRKPSFAIKIEAGEPLCHCFSCGYGGRLSALIMELLYLRRADGDDIGGLVDLMNQITDEGSHLHLEVVEEPESPFDIPEDWLESFPRATDCEPALDYMAGRLADHDSEMAPEDHLQWTLVAMDVRYDPVNRRVCFPIRDADTGLIGLQGRAIDPDREPRYLFYKYRDRVNRDLVLRAQSVDPERPVLLMEGPVDVAKVLPVYDNVVCTFTSSVSDAQAKVLQLCDQVITFYDRGTGGDKGRLRVEKLWWGRAARIVNIVPPKPYDDAADMSYRQCRELVNTSVANFGKLRL